MEGKSAQLGGSELTQEAMQARSEGRAHALAQGRASDIALTPVLSRFERMQSIATSNIPIKGTLGYHCSNPTKI